eukprot:PLAT14015.1.p1 GENE.PLAT14015.1~~PLAT14015.1.p1  ORF type:complete len:502 (-),score=252.20 PLAT14015.1:1643-3013(-)
MAHSGLHWTSSRALLSTDRPRLKRRRSSFRGEEDATVWECFRALPLMAREQSPEDVATAVNGAYASAVQLTTRTMSDIDVRAELVEPVPAGLVLEGSIRVCLQGDSHWRVLYARLRELQLLLYKTEASAEAEVTLDLTAAVVEAPFSVADRRHSMRGRMFCFQLFTASRRVEALSSTRGSITQFAAASGTEEGGRRWMESIAIFCARARSMFRATLLMVMDDAAKADIPVSPPLLYFPYELTDDRCPAAAVSLWPAQSVLCTPGAWLAKDACVALSDEVTVEGCFPPMKLHTYTNSSSDRRASLLLSFNIPGSYLELNLNLPPYAGLPGRGQLQTWCSTVLVQRRHFLCADALVHVSHAFAFARGDSLGALPVSFFRCCGPGRLLLKMMDRRAVMRLLEPGDALHLTDVKLVIAAEVTVTFEASGDSATGVTVLGPGHVWCSGVQQFGRVKSAKTV